MERKEIVRRAIEFDMPPRLPFFLGSAWTKKLLKQFEDFPNDFCDSWEMDRQEAGWFFDNAAPDDWGCQWKTTTSKNMGQVVSHPLENWNKLDSYTPPDPKNPFYFKRIDEEIQDAGDRYTIITSHFNLIERLEMLRGFANTLVDFYMEPEKINKVLDMILEYKVEHIREAGRRFGDRVNGIFLTDDWGTQENTYISQDLFREFFLDRYKELYKVVHDNGWHVIQHSCGNVVDFVPLFMEAGVDVMNMQQPRVYGIENVGNKFAGKICFLTTVDIQNTLPKCNHDEVRQEAVELVKHWSRPSGGLIVFNYGDSDAIGTTDDVTNTMFQAFYDLKDYWQGKVPLEELKN